MHYMNTEHFWIVDSNLYPVWHKRVDRATADDWIERGEAWGTLPAHLYDLVWAKRHGVPARWLLFPHEENRPALTIYT